MNPILILGSNSDIALATATLWAQQKRPLILAARDEPELEKNAQNLRIRYQASITCIPFDAQKTESRQELLSKLPQSLEGVLLAYGSLPDQNLCQQQEDQRETLLQINLNTAIHLLEPIASLMETQKKGFIAVISSVAGDRGRASNYLYGTCKAGLTAYLSGLRNRLASANIQVLTIKPGLVATKMTEKLPLPKKLTASPQQVAQDILKAIQQKKNTLYTPWFWKWIMRIIIHIPEPIFKRLKL